MIRSKGFFQEPGHSGLGISTETYGCGCTIITGHSRECEERVRKALSKKAQGRRAKKGKHSTSFTPKRGKTQSAPVRLSLLGAGKRTRYPQTPTEAKLEAFPNPRPELLSRIHFETEEFTSLCEVTNQPDFGKLEIDYIPKDKCIESKSLKLYLFAFRNVNVFYERAVCQIAFDLGMFLQPYSLRVRARMRPRGGLILEADAQWPPIKAGQGFRYGD